MKIIIYVFSGTGNTFAVANLYKKYFEASGENQVTIYKISKKSGEAPSPADFDIVGLGYPIHAFSAPEPAIKFCKGLPVCQNKRTFIFKTSGEGLHLNDFSSQKCIKILKKKGYDVMLERHIVMPYNMIYRHNDEMAKHMWIYAHALADINCREILEGKREKVKRSAILGCWMPPIRFIEQKFAHMHGTAFKVDKKKCVGCNRCVNVCPQNNIEVADGKYKFGHKCVLCMDCSFGCPKDAVKVGVFKFWKVNGSYRLDELKGDESLQFPYIPTRAKGIYKLYKKYYRECDKRLKEAGININDYVHKN
ncbi:MAG: EFR1 family ferrodoxin [Clostridiales bacterium]|nr:EFR1 family ferrodoxin [Clostridiales bacterium]